MSLNAIAKHHPTKNKRLCSVIDRAGPLDPALPTECKGVLLAAALLLSGGRAGLAATDVEGDAVGTALVVKCSAPFRHKGIFGGRARRYKRLLRETPLARPVHRVFL